MTFKSEYGVVYVFVTVAAAETAISVSTVNGYVVPPSMDPNT